MSKNITTSKEKITGSGLTDEHQSMMDVSETAAMLFATKPYYL